MFLGSFKERRRSRGKRDQFILSVLNNWDWGVSKEVYYPMAMASWSTLYFGLVSSGAAEC